MCKMTNSIIVATCGENLQWFVIWCWQWIRNQTTTWSSLSSYFTMRNCVYMFYYNYKPLLSLSALAVILICHFTHTVCKLLKWLRVPMSLSYFCNMAYGWVGYGWLCVLNSNFTKHTVCSLITHVLTRRYARWAITAYSLIMSSQYIVVQSGSTYMS